MFKRIKYLLSRDLFKAISIYATSGILAKSIPFLLLPVFTHYLSTSDYGIISLISSSILALMPFLNLGMIDQITIEYKKRERTSYIVFLGTTLGLSFLFCLIILLLAISFSNFFSHLSTLPLIGVILIPVLTYFGFSNDLLLTLVRNNDNRKFFLLLNILRTAIESSLAIILIVIFKMQWMGRVNSIFLTGALFASFLIYYIFKKKELYPNLNLENIKAIVRFGLPTIPLYFMIFTLYNADKFLISKILNSKESVGLYAVAFQIAYIIQVFVTAINTAFLPKLYDWIKENSEASKIKIVKTIYISTFFIFLIGFALYLFSPILYHFFIDTKYYSSIRLLPYFIICFAIWNIFICLLPFIYYFRKNNYLYYVNSVVIAVSLTTLYYFIKQFGLIGACFSNILSFSILVILMSVLANRIYRLPWLYFIAAKK
jgi:O-antigen/teichoic acid export membrane protein